jgi:hypothetical protein
VRACEEAATIHFVPSFGQCKASLSNGRRCYLVIETKGSGFCPHHLQLAQEHGADAVMDGAVPKRRALCPSSSHSLPWRLTGSSAGGRFVLPALFSGLDAALRRSALYSLNDPGRP